MNHCRALPSSLLLLLTAGTLAACAQQTSAAGSQGPVTVLELAPSSPAQVAAAEPAPAEPTARARPEDKLIGVWTIDLEATMAADERLKAMTEEQRAKVKELAAKAFEESRFEFTTDGRMIATFAGKREEGSYAVTSVQGDTFVLSTKGEGGKAEEVTARLTGGKLIFTLKGQQIFLKRI